MKVKATWKSFEREVAKYFGTTRFIPQTTNDKKASCDFSTDTIIGECKYRRYLPTGKEIADWLHTVCNRAGQEGKAGVLCFKAKGGRGFWVVERTLDGQPFMWHSSWRKPVKADL